jgi:hypothetical protein
MCFILKRGMSVFFAYFCVFHTYFIPQMHVILHILHILFLVLQFSFHVVAYDLHIAWHIFHIIFILSIFYLHISFQILHISFHIWHFASALSCQVAVQMVWRQASGSMSSLKTLVNGPGPYSHSSHSSGSVNDLRREPPGRSSVLGGASLVRSVLLKPSLPAVNKILASTLLLVLRRDFSTLRLPISFVHIFVGIYVGKREKPIKLSMSALKPLPIIYISLVSSPFFLYLRN